MKSDEELIEEISGGNDGAFEVLYHRYRDWVHGLAYRFTGSDAEALDVAQETFMYLLKKFPGFVLTAKMTTFLYPAVKNFSITTAKKRRRFKFVSPETAFSSEIAKPDCPIDAQREELRAAMEVLPENHREVVRVFFKQVDIKKESQQHSQWKVEGLLMRDLTNRNRWSVLTADHYLVHGNGAAIDFYPGNLTKRRRAETVFYREANLVCTVFQTGPIVEFAQDAGWNE